MMYRRDFFELAIKFCDIVSEKNNIGYISLMENYTPIKIRLFKNVKKEEAERDWKRICDLVQRDKSEAVDFIYETYLKNKGVNSTRDLNQNNFGCFHYDYHEDIDAYELHLDVVDKKGVLSRDRLDERRKDLASMFRSISYHEKPGSKFFVRTWLLNINAFKSLFPAEFVESAQPTEVEMNSNAAWGQFIDRDNNLRKTVVEEFLRNLNGERQDKISSYFPNITKQAEAKVKVFLDFYEDSE